MPIADVWRSARARTARCVTCLLIAALFMIAGSHRAEAQQSSSDPVASSAAPPSSAQAKPVTVACVSKAGERNACPADTSSGVVLLRSSGEAPCLLGKTWDYDQTSVWVADGCSGEFVTGRMEVPAT